MLIRRKMESFFWHLNQIQPCMSALPQTQRAPVCEACQSGGVIFLSFKRYRPEMDHGKGF